MCFEGGKTHLGFSLPLEVSNEDASPVTLTDTSYSTGCVARTEKDSAHPSLWKVKAFPEFDSDAASILHHSWSFLSPEIRHSSPGWLIG